MNKPNQFPQSQFHINVNAKELPNVVCKGKRPNGDPCGGIYFLRVVEMRVASALITGSPKDTIVPIDAFRCIDCGAIITITDPDPAIEGRPRSTS